MFREATSIVGDVKGLAVTGLRAFRTRLELLGIELSEEKAWIVRSLVIAIAALYLVTFGLLLAIFALVLWSAEENRPAVLGFAALVFLIAGFGGMAYIASASKKRQPLFAETVAVLKGDEAALKQNLQAAGDD